jgi:hypothetical protein
VELLHPRCAGLDVAKDEVVACVRVPDGRGGRAQEVRTFPTFTSGLEALAAWLAAEGITQVVLEATGQLLEAGLAGAGGAGLPAAVGQRPPRQDPARPQDRRGRCRLAGGAAGAWAAAGQLRASSPDPGATRSDPLSQAAPSRPMPPRASASSRTLEDAGIKLDSVASDVLGVSGRAMLAALVAGERDPQVLAELAKGRLRRQLAPAAPGPAGAVWCPPRTLDPPRPGAPGAAGSVDRRARRSGRPDPRPVRGSSGPTRHDYRGGQAGRGDDRRRARGRHVGVPHRRPPGLLGRPLPRQQPHRGQTSLRQAHQGQPLAG